MKYFKKIKSIIHPTRKKTDKLNPFSYSFFQKNGLLLFLLILIFLRGLYFFNYFSVPNVHFYDFELKASSILNLKYWYQFRGLFYGRILPFYSFIIASFVFFTSSPILLAAEIVNLIFSISALYILYLISSKFLKRTAFIVVFLVALEPMMTHLTTQPILEMLFLNLILLTLYLSITKKKKAYLAALLTSLTRYEGFLLPAIVTVKDLFYSDRKLFYLILGGLSSLGILAWLVLGLPIDRHPYISDVKSFGSVGFEFIIGTVRYFFKLLIPLDFWYINIQEIPKYFLIVIFPLGIATIIGGYLLIRDNFKKFLPILLFFVGYIFLHCIFVKAYDRFIFPIVWIFYLISMYGVESISQRIPVKNKYFKIFLISGSIFFIYLISNFNFSIPEHTSPYDVFFFSGFASLMFIFVTVRTRNINHWNRLFIIVFVMSLFSYIIMNFMLSTNETMNRFRYTLAEFRDVGEWYAQNAKENDYLVSPMGDVVHYYYMRTDPNYSLRIISVKGLNCNSTSCIIAKFNTTAQFNKTDTSSTYIVIYSEIERIFTFYNTNKVYLLEDLIDEYSLNFKLVKKIVTGSNSSALIYRFVP